MPGLYPF